MQKEFFEFLSVFLIFRMIWIFLPMFSIFLLPNNPVDNKISTLQFRVSIIVSLLRLLSHLVRCDSDIIYPEISSAIRIWFQIFLSLISCSGNFSMEMLISLHLPSLNNCARLVRFMKNTVQAVQHSSPPTSPDIW